MTARCSERVAVVTGAVKGMGRQTAQDLASEGATVVLADIDTQALEAVVPRIRSAGGKAFGRLWDVSSRPQADELIEGSCREHGGVHILINNAGVLIPGTIEETSDGIVDTTLDADVKNVLYAIRAVTPIMTCATSTIHHLHAQQHDLGEQLRQNRYVTSTERIQRTKVRNLVA